MHPSSHSPSSSARWRWLDAWFDAANTGRATLVLLGLFVATWTTFYIIAQGSVGLHDDFLEVYDWSRHPSAGYVKHPPLGAWMAAAWFAVFPVADWSFHLLSVLNTALALFAIDLIARRYLTGDKRLLVLLMVLLTPFYQFLGHRFGATQTLLATWPLATYCFLRAFDTRSVVWSALAGMAAAATMLGKYYSAFLIAGFVIAALAHPARWTYLRSSSPWISAACGLIALAPHLHWVVMNEFKPMGYAFGVHGSAIFAMVASKTAAYLVGGLAYLSVPIIVYLAAVRPSLATLKEALWPSDPDRRMLVTMLASFVLVPAVVALIFSIRLTSLWTMPAWFLLPIVLLAPNTVVLPRAAARYAALLVIAISAGALFASPGLAWYRHLHGVKDGDEYHRMTSEYITAAWRQAFGSPLRFVVGTRDHLSPSAFYSPDRPEVIPGGHFANTPWISAQDVSRYGFAMVCKLDNSWCAADMERHRQSNPAARGFKVDICNRYLGTPSRPRRVVILFVPPAQSAAASDTRPAPPHPAGFESMCATQGRK